MERRCGKETFLYIHFVLNCISLPPIRNLNLKKACCCAPCPLLELTSRMLSPQVKSKTVAQCVEYYYTWKKIMRLGRKHRTRLTELIDDSVVSEPLSRLC